jgi:hypothetical protein
MSSWYPPRIKMVEGWSPLFESNLEAREVMRKHREEQSFSLMKPPRAEPYEAGSEGL